MPQARWISRAIWLLKDSIRPEVIRCLKNAVTAGRSRSKPLAKCISGAMPEASTVVHHRLILVRAQAPRKRGPYRLPVFLRCIA